MRWFRFVRRHKRLPRPRSRRYNDFLYSFLGSSAVEDPLRRFVSDKEFVKIFVAGVAGENHVVPTRALYRERSSALAATYPALTAVKPTHLSGAVFFTGAEAAQPPAALLRSWFDLDFYSESRERNYRGLAPKVIVEPLIFGRESPEDIKVFCYDGHALFLWIDVGRFSGHRRACFDRDGAELPFEIGFPRAEGVRLPANRPELLALAEKLARPFRGQVRVDLYTDGRAIYCGELTNCPGGALDKFPSAAAEDWLSARIFATH